jgi:hypothetical protein
LFLGRLHAVGCRSGGRQSGQPFRRQIFEHALASAFAAITGFTIAAESAGCVELVGGVHPDHASLDLGSQIERNVNVLAPDAGRESVHRVVGQLRSLRWSAEGHGGEHGAEDFFLRHRRRGMHIGEQSRREVRAFFGERVARLPTAGALRHSSVDHAADGFQLDRGNNRADVDRLVEWMTDAQRFHALADSGIEGLCDTFLDQEPGTGTAHLALVEPDGVDEALDSGVEIGVIEDNEGRLATQFEGKLLIGLRGGFANDAADFGRAGEGDLIDAGMFDQGLTGSRAAIHHIQHTGRQTHFDRELSESERGERGIFGGLDDDGVAGSQRGRDFPGKHEQRKIPRDDLADHAAGGVAGKLRLQ